MEMEKGMKPALHDSVKSELTIESLRGTEPPVCGWTAIVLAGQRPEGDPLTSHHDVKYKALIPVEGLSMLEHVTNALLSNRQIGKVIILAQTPDALKTELTEKLVAHDRITFLQSDNGIAGSIKKLAGTKKAPWPVLVTTADNILLTSEILDCFLASSTQHDVSVGVVEKDTVLAAYPDTRRTWLKFRGGAYSGANLFALLNAASVPAISLWASVEKDRKKSWKIFARFGPWLLFRALSRTISFKDAIGQAGDTLSLSAVPVELPVADAAIDVDKPSDLDLVKQILERRKQVSFAEIE